MPNAFRLKSRLVFLAGRPPESDPTHLHLFSPSAVRELLADFDQVQLRFVAGRADAAPPAPLRQRHLLQRPEAAALKSSSCSALQAVEAAPADGGGR